MSPDLLLRIGSATLDTMYMVAIAGLVGSLIG
ncbi:DL-methionine transporter permease subunit, partial [Sinorhizobium meliloti]